MTSFTLSKLFSIRWMLLNFGGCPLSLHVSFSDVHFVSRYSLIFSRFLNTKCTSLAAICRSLQRAPASYTSCVMEPVSFGFNRRSIITFWIAICQDKLWFWTEIWLFYDCNLAQTFRKLPGTLEFDETLPNNFIELVVEQSRHVFSYLCSRTEDIIVNIANPEL